jgi:hypothetical protein
MGIRLAARGGGGKSSSVLMAALDHLFGEDANAPCDAFSYEDFVGRDVWHKDGESSVKGESRRITIAKMEKLPTQVVTPRMNASLIRGLTHDSTDGADQHCEADSISQSPSPIEVFEKVELERVPISFAYSPPWMSCPHFLVPPRELQQVK